MRKFKKGEEFEPNVGETFIYNCKKIKCVLDASSIKCNGCYFLGIPQCSDVRCIGHSRKDCNSVRFVEVKEEPKCEYELYVNGYRLVGVEHKTLEDYKGLIPTLNIKNGDSVEIKELKTVYTKVGKDVNEEIDSYEKALKYIRSNKISKASMAIGKLLTISEAWNKADGFVVDWDSSEQLIYVPSFRYVDGAFVFLNTPCYTLNYLEASCRICFKTSERAEQFGRQFIDLWNDFLLNK